MNPAWIRARLPRTYGALLARHGTPNEVQCAAAVPILAGRDVLLCAPTASGKTEAYLAPLCEVHCRWGDDAHKRPRLLLVSPTRALANDLYRRIRGPLATVGIPVGRWTGDYHDGGRLQEVTVLTPEGLDARLSRSRDALRSVRAVVLDELHVLDGSARGDQLRVLLQRLRQGQPVQAVAASATVPQVGEMAARYLGQASLVEVGDPRSIRARIVEVSGPEGVAQELRREVERGFRKVLAFVNSREDAEVYARKLRGRPPFGDAVFAHHGSLARGQRLRVEGQFLSRPVGLCVATSTLELGIDIGDIDLVALLGAPPDVASLVQRAGRGGRKTAVNPVLALARSPMEAALMRVMLRARSAGEYLAAPYAFRPGVLVQQAVSLLHENPGRWVSAAALRVRLPSVLQDEWSEARLDKVLQAASRAGWLAPAGSRWVLGEKGERLWGLGRLHANLESRRLVDVRDALTGDSIGEVAQAAGGGIGLSGQGRRVITLEDGRAVTAVDGSGGLADFGAGARAPTSRALAESLLQALEIPRPSQAVVARGIGLYHGLGTAGGALLAGALKVARARVVRSGPLALVLADLPAAWPGAAAVSRALSRFHSGMARALAMGAYHRQLPEDEQRAAVAALAEQAAVAQFLGRCAAGEIPEAIGEHLEEVAWF